jgi:hypothetical protein
MLWFKSKAEKARDAMRTFWQWFQQNETLLLAFEQQQNVVFAKLAAQLKPIDPELVFAFGPVSEGRREFVISAGGIKSVIPAVQALVAAAPELPRWRITAFRPRVPGSQTINIGNCTVTPDDVACTLHADDGKVAISLFMRGYTDARRNVYGSIGYILLDSALGEWDVMTKVGGIRFTAWETPSPLPKIPLAELAAAFDAWRI